MAIDSKTTVLNGALLACIQAIQEGKDEEKDTFARLALPYITLSIQSFYPNYDDRLSTAGAIISKALEKISVFDLSKKPLPFMRRIAVNHCIDEFRSKKARQGREFFAGHRTHKNSVYRIESIEMDLEEIYGPFKTVISKRYLEGKSIPVIAKELDLPTKTVSFQLRMAIIRAKEYLKEN